MLERLFERGRALAERRAEARRSALAEQLRRELPPGVSAEEAAEGAVLSGRGLARRFATDPALRWLPARLT
jgi:hypothetical protein